MNCIYCKKPNAVSQAHIIPEALGKGPFLNSGVCEKCNNEINKEIEEYVSRELVFIRNFLQLKGKRNKRPSIDIAANFNGQKLMISVADPRDFEDRILPFKTTDQSGRTEKIAFISPNSENLEQAKKDYEKKHPEITWERIESENIKDELKFEVSFDFGVFADSKFLRLAAKIAFEWFCKKRNPDYLLDADFDEIRNYIRFGQEFHTPVSIVSDKKILGLFNGIPFGVHTLLIGAQPMNSDLVVIVGLFSLVHYKVILSRKFKALCQLEDLAIVNPQLGLYEPIIKKSLGPSPNISRKLKSDSVAPIETINGMKDYLVERLNDGISKIRFT